MAKKFNVPVELSSVSNATGDVLTISGNVVSKRTTSELLSDIGASATSHNHTLDGLSNVTVTSNSSGEILKWNGSAWVNNTLAEANLAAADAVVLLSGDQTVAGVKTFSSTISGAVSGNAGTATALANARTINGTSFNGTANITVPGSFANRTTNESGHLTFIGTTATGNQSLYTNTALRVNPSTATISATTFVGALTGNASTATSLQTGRTIAISGAVTGTATSFNGTGNITIPITALDVSSATTGTLAVARGGTGIASYTTGNYIRASGSTTLEQRTAAQVLSDIGGAESSHTHDDRYYTESEVTSLLSGYSQTSHNHTLDSLSNVTITSNASGELLMWNGSAWINRTLAEASVSSTSHSHTLDALSNVTITSNSSGEILKWNGSSWINNTLAEAGVAASTHVHAAADTTSGTFDIARIPTGTSGTTAALGNHNHTLDALSNVTITSNSSGELLKWNGSAWINNTLAEAGISGTSHNHTLDALSNVTITSNSSGELLKWNGSAWINNTLAEAGIAATSHAHSASDVTSGTLAVARGGTGIASYTTGNFLQASGATTLVQRTPAQVLDDIDAAAASHNHDDVYITVVAHGSSASTARPAGAVIVYWVGDVEPDNSEEGDIWYDPDGIGSGGSATLEGLTDVTITSNSSGELLMWNGSAWINQTLAEASVSSTSHNHTLDALSNVTITSNSSGEILKWNGSAWINNTLAEAGIVSSALSGQSGGTNGKVVRYASANTWTDASQADTIAELTGVVFKQGDAYYPPGSHITGLSSLTSGSVYYLSTSGNITATPPTPGASIRLLVIGKATSTTSLLFTPMMPISG